jgi:hypothetical protein
MNVPRTLRVWVLAGTAVAAMFALSTTAHIEAVQDEGFRVDQARGPVDLGITDRALVGAIDIHTHLVPDSPGANGNNRAIDAFEFAKLAKARGMRGFVMKSQHDLSSAGVAYLVRKYGTPDVESFGCLALNLSVGGINVAAVEQFAQINGGWGRIIMMPSRDNERERDTPPDQVARQRPYVLLLPPGADTVVSVARNGELLPNVKHLIGVVAKLRTVDTRAPLVLATGHASPEEHVLLAREGRRLGLQVVLTHGSGAPVPQQLEAAKLGAYIEMTISGLVRGGTEAARQAVETIRKVGAESYIISSDCGQMSNPYPTDCLGLAARALRAQGITDRELDLMFKVNPARLLGLPALPTS